MVELNDMTEENVYTFVRHSWMEAHRKEVHLNNECVAHDESGALENDTVEDNGNVDVNVDEKANDNDNDDDDVVVEDDDAADTVVFGDDDAYGIPSIGLIVGNEIDGVSSEMMHEADLYVVLPLNGFTEGLTVSITTGMCTCAQINGCMYGWVFVHCLCVCVHMCMCAQL